MHRIAALSRYALIEARHASLPLLLAAAVAVVLAAAFFAAELAVIEGERVRIAFYAAGVRLAAVFIVTAHVIAGICREFDDKGIDTLLALDLPRSHYILGKLGGFAALAALTALACALPLMLSVALVPWLQWSLALALELVLLAAFALFCVIAFAQFIPAALTALGFYVLARTLSAIQLMSAHPITGAGTPSQSVLRWVVDALALVMPALDRWPQTAWLIDAPATWSAFALILVQAMAYLVLLASAAMVDFQRRNF
jgi:hypothetical protein